MKKNELDKRSISCKMKDSICEEDIKQALRKQLEDNVEDAVPVRKSKNKKRGIPLLKQEESSSQTKKRKFPKEDKLELTHDKNGMNETKRTPFQSALIIKDIQRPPRAPPKVVVFEELGKSKDKIMSQSSNRLKEKIAEDSEDIDFLEIARDVKEFGMTGFSKKERRKYEQQKAQALGAKAPKGAKMPYNILIAHQKKQKQKEMKRLKLEKAMGMSTKKSKSKNSKKENPTSSSGWWTDKSSKGLDTTIGKYKKGVQMLSKADIKRLKKKTK